MYLYIYMHSHPLSYHFYRQLRHCCMSLSSSLPLLHHISSGSTASVCGSSGDLKTCFSLGFVVKIDKKASLGHVHRALILTVHKEGYSDRKVGVKLHFCTAAVHLTMKNVENYGTYGNMGRSERPMKTNIRDYYMMTPVATPSPSSFTMSEQ